MKTPKLLPWLARKSGISDARADELWAEAIRSACLVSDTFESSAYWKAAMDRLIALIEVEKEASVRRDRRFFPLVPTREVRTWQCFCIAPRARISQSAQATPPALDRQPPPIEPIPLSATHAVNPPIHRSCI